MLSMLVRCFSFADVTLPVHLGRYHYNVANSRVEQHVEKGNDDGLFISSVACCQELWALIMDAGTGFSAQARACTLLIAFRQRFWLI